MLIGDPANVPALMGVLGDKHSVVRANAAGALGAIGDPAAAPALTKLLKDNSKLVRRHASEALASIGIKNEGTGT